MKVTRTLLADAPMALAGVCQAMGFMRADIWRRFGALGNVGKNALAIRTEITATLVRQGRTRSTMLRVSLEQEAILQDILGNNLAELEATQRAVSLTGAARAIGASPKYTFRARGYALSNGAQYDDAARFRRCTPSTSVGAS